jgi:hypothetical protein
MSSSDGSVNGVHKIVDHGPNSQRYNVVTLGDGYRASELAQYASDVDNFVATFRSTAPFNNFWDAINMHRVDVVSTDSGADDPGTCGDNTTGSGATPRTFFDSTFCGGSGQIRRLLTCDGTSAKNVARQQVPEVHRAMVIVNSSEYGGSGGEVATFSTHADSVEIGLHEMGHSAFGLADEYESFVGCASGETGHDSYSGSEPSEPNVTANPSATIKWGAQLTDPAGPLPTTANADCTKCDPQANPKGVGYVGAYEGAQYFHCKLYRPEFACRMRALDNPFCAVCRHAIMQTLAPFAPPVSVQSFVGVRFVEWRFARDSNSRTVDELKANALTAVDPRTGTPPFQIHPGVPGDQDDQGLTQERLTFLFSAVEFKVVNIDPSRGEQPARFVQQTPDTGVVPAGTVVTLTRVAFG